MLSIPALGLRGVRVVPYAGTPDDRPGTAIQDAGDLAAPHGGGGLVGPGGLGNFLVTGHRTSSTRPFAALPSLRPGARVVVETRTHRLVYEITRTRWTSFRRPSSLRAQSAAVPGHPGRAPTRAMITLSTCATPEDHAAGNFWSDELHNPEHRIDKIGVLRSLRRSEAAVRIRTRRAFRLSSSGPAARRGQAPVAQRIEHLTTDQKVGGSNPSGRAG